MAVPDAKPSRSRFRIRHACAAFGGLLVISYGSAMIDIYGGLALRPRDRILRQPAANPESAVVDLPGDPDWLGQRRGTSTTPAA